MTIEELTDPMKTEFSKRTQLPIGCSRKMKIACAVRTQEVVEDKERGYGPNPK
jgi:hypothetical protein